MHIVYEYIEVFMHKCNKKVYLSYKKKITSFFSTKKVKSPRKTLFS